MCVYVLNGPKLVLQLANRTRQSKLIADTHWKRFDSCWIFRPIGSRQGLGGRHVVMTGAVSSVGSQLLSCQISGSLNPDWWISPVGKAWDWGQSLMGWKNKAGTLDQRGEGSDPGSHLWHQKCCTNKQFSRSLDITWVSCNAVHLWY